MRDSFEIGLTCDFLTPDGELPFRDIGLDVLSENPAIHHRFMDSHPLLLTAEHIRDYDAIVSLAPRYTADTLDGVEQLVIISRFGVGYDMVDVEACTAADVALSIAKGAVDNSMAEAILAWMFALNYRVFEKDRLQRDGEWDTKLSYTGRELRERQLGLIGLGGIGRKLVQKVSALEMKPVLAYDPYLPATSAATMGAKLVSLEALLKSSDIVCVCCPLNDKTRGLMGREQFAMMKPDAYFINAARGPIVDEASLVEALRDQRIAGAAIDVFEHEPSSKDHPLNALDNVILAPHCIGYTHEMFRDIGHAACAAALEASQGQVPRNVVNPEVLKRPGFRKKLDRARERWQNGEPTKAPVTNAE